MRFVVSYDISCDRRRKKVSDLLQSMLTRVQLSVFEGDLPVEPLQKLVQRTLEHLDGETDSIRVYHLCASCAPRVDVYGRGITVEPQPVRIL
jgi:CRISPR-associated protein Cas2